jgi:hypothetical protein
MNWTKIFIDPSSGDPSMSRVCFGLLVVNIIAMSWARMCGVNPTGFEKAITPLVTALGIDAGVYLTSTGAGAWRRSGLLQPGKIEAPEKPVEGPVG